MADNSVFNLTRSVRDKCLYSPTFQQLIPGPLIVPFAPVPKRPGPGMPKAAGLNQREIERGSAGRFGSLNWSGRRVTLAGVVLVVNAVPVVSGPVYCGVRN